MSPIEKPNQFAEHNINFSRCTIVMHCRPTECPVAIPSTMKNISLGYIIIVTTIKSRTLLYNAYINYYVYELIA